MGSVFAAIGRFFTDLLAKIVGAVQWVGQLFVQVFVSLWHMLTDVFVWLFDSLMGIAVVALGGLTIDLPSLGPLFSNLDPEVLNIIGLIGLAEALGIIASAIVIRLVLQTIPFVRWGS